MDDDHLRAEFERLSGIYPELSHCLIVWLGDECHDEEILAAIIRRHGFTPLGLGSTLDNDSRTEAFYMWAGAAQDERAIAAVDAFEALASVAAALQSLRTFPGRIAPRVLVSSFDGSLDKHTGVFISSGGRRDTRISDWLGHLHASPVDTVTEVSIRTPDGEQYHGELHLLPLNLFRSCALSLSDNQEGENPSVIVPKKKSIRPTGPTRRAIRLIQEGHRTNRQIEEMAKVKNVAKIRSRLKNDLSRE